MITDDDNDFFRGIPLCCRHKRNILVLIMETSKWVASAYNLCDYVA